ncbi:MAG TPA: hypothetical protein PLF27_10700 [Sedimentibacter sp.]|nr:hypothetical protein [Sedimentibacter sp.]
MTNDIDKIELRSEKVRNIIGQIPPRIIRVGNTVIFFIIVGFLIGSYYFKYEYTIKTTAVIHQSEDTTKIHVKIPANEIEKVNAGQKVFLSFDNIPYVYNEKISVQIQSIPQAINMSQNGGFYNAEIVLTGKLQSENDNDINIDDKIEVKAEIICGKISFFDKFTEPFRSILKTND